MTINLILQSATKSVNPPVKAFSLGDGYEQTHSTAIADTEIWTVSTIPLDDDDANDLETALNALQGDTFTWIPPYGSSGDYRLNSRITRTMVGYRRSILQFSLRKVLELVVSPSIQSFVYVASYQQGGIADTSNWSANLCNAGVRVRTIEPFSITGYDAELTDEQKSSIRVDILTNARYKADGIFYVLEWNGQKKRLVPTGDAGSGVASIQQPVIDHVLSLGGVYHTPICVYGSWLSANTPIYMMVDEGENIVININNPVETTFV